MIEQTLSELLAAMKELTAELRNQRTGVVVNTVSDKSLIVDNTTEERKAEAKPLVSVTTASTLKVTTEETPEAVVVTVEDKPEQITVEGDPEALVDKAGPAYQEMKDAILALARTPNGGKELATAVLAEFGIDKMFNAKNRQVPGIVKRAREELAKATVA